MITGFVNGLFGGGGGMVVVPALARFCGFSVKEAHATAILVMLPVTAASAIVYLFGGFYDGNVLVPCALGVTLGGGIGAIALKKLSSPAVARLFSLVMLFAGIRMFFS